MRSGNGRRDVPGRNRHTSNPGRPQVGHGRFFAKWTSSTTVASRTLAQNSHLWVTSSHYPFQDTQDYLFERLANGKGRPVTRISGQDSYTPGPPREERIRQFRDAGEGILLCTETAAESLNLQFCTALVNYDIPWNPMTLEQRIGRIDRIGQERPTIDVVNQFYDDTAEYDAYQIMEERMKAIRGTSALPAHHATQR